MKQQPSIIYKRFLQKTESTATYQKRTIAEIQDEICIVDLTLSPKGSWHFMPEFNTILAIPLAGGIQVQEPEKMHTIPVGNFLELYPTAENHVAITNPFASETVNCILIHYNSAPGQSQLQTLELPFFQWQNNPMHLTLRQFSNREEFEFMPQKPNHPLWAICLAGAFEFENRLLEDRDGLQLISPHLCEMESLCEGSILGLIQL